MSSILFWGVAGTMTVAVSGLMIAGLGAGKRDEKAAPSDLRVYRDQLLEVERDLARGTISAEEAERLRVEIGRRVLAADRAASSAALAGKSGPSRLVTSVAIVALVAATSFGLYLMRGNPGLPDRPMVQRLAESAELRANRPSQAEVEGIVAASRPAPKDEDPQHAQLMEQLRKVTAERPNDLRGQELLARNEAGLGNFAAAAKAQAQVVAIKGDQATADDLAMQAELMIAAAGEFVSPEAEEVLSRTLALDPQNGLARFYSGVLFSQIERYDLAFRFWAQLWDNTTEADPWAKTLQERLPDMAWLAGEMRYQLPPLKAASTRGPDAAAVAAAQDMSPEERAKMVQGMVDGLMNRLANQGGTSAEWAQLIRALTVLGDGERAQSIYNEAKTRFEGRPSDLELVTKAATEAGLK